MKVVFLSGNDILKEINNGGAVCNRCGARMAARVKPGYFVCPNCGSEEDQAEYEYEPFHNDPWSEVSRSAFHNDIPPEGCRACGGPYPKCVDSCKLFD